MNLNEYKNQSEKLPVWSVVLEKNEVDVKVYSEFARVKVDGLQLKSNVIISVTTKSKINFLLFFLYTYN